MKRCLLFLLLTALISLAGIERGSAFPSVNASLIAFGGGSLTEAEENRGGWRRYLFGRRSDDDEEDRKGAGAGFWGGPYWGYGPRWGHACETCRAECEDGEENPRCNRCRVRCGW